MTLFHRVTERQGWAFLDLSIYSGMVTFAYRPCPLSSTGGMRKPKGFLGMSLHFPEELILMMRQEQAGSFVLVSQIELHPGVVSLGCCLEGL